MPNETDPYRVRELVAAATMLQARVVVQAERMDEDESRELVNTVADVIRTVNELAPITPQ